jgi:hypothetical protein
MRPPFRVVQARNSGAMLCHPTILPMSINASPHRRVPSIDDVMSMPDREGPKVKEIADVR